MKIKKLISFIHEVEKMKMILRHSWLSSGRRESDAEHSWRMALMAIVIHPYLRPKPDLLKTLKMIVIHDLCEVYAGDHWAFNPAKHNKHLTEKRGLKRVLRNLPSTTRKEITDLWLEFEERKTPTAQFAYALDKFEVLLQHNEADIKFLNKKEYPFNLVCAPESSMKDVFLKSMRKYIREETLRVYKKNKVDKRKYKI